MHKNLLDAKNVSTVRGVVDTSRCILSSTLIDTLSAFSNRCVSIRLISATRAAVGKKAYLKGVFTTIPTLEPEECEFDVYFDWDVEEMGIPGAFTIKNHLTVEFFLVSLTLEDVPTREEPMHFVCNSWVYNHFVYTEDRIFFSNETYVPNETPVPLVNYREEELQILRGNGKGKLKQYHRVYDYDVYNDLGNPHTSGHLARQVLGGSDTHPYPRRGRTGRKPTIEDCNSERPGHRIYVPRDEHFGHLKSSEFLSSVIKSSARKVLHLHKPLLDSITSKEEFNSFDEVHKLFDVHELCEGGFEHSFPVPHVIRVSKSAWMTDEEFAREMLAGANPCTIRCLQKFPPQSKLDSSVHGDQTSKMTEQQLEINLEGLTVDKAIKCRRLFILDYHDVFMSFLGRINEDTPKAYATRTILFLKDDGTLKPLAIELSLSQHSSGQVGALSKVVLPAEKGVENTIWLLAKAHVIVNDSCYHQLISHWLNTHAVIEPFIIATNRNLSVLHPLHKLLFPHYRDTMNINALARQSLINADGTIEQSFLSGKYSMEISSAMYKDWVFPDQALPADLIKRGMAIEDSSSPNGLGLVIEDYPFAVDGLEIWDAIKIWVQEYVSLYYPTDVAVQQDTELQAWWKEVVEKGHADLKDKPWWPKMKTLEELIQSCSTIIWIASAFHAAVNFGQYPYGGFILNRPTLSRRLIPEKGTPEYDEMEKNPEKAYLRTITPKYETLVDLSVIEILSKHASDEVYLGQRDNPNWTSNRRAIEAFKRFGEKLSEIEKNISERNHDPNLKNRTGPAHLPYTVLLPTSEKGLTFRGIPNSVSI